MFECFVCGADFFLDTSEVAHHWGSDLDDIDHDADADHVPYNLDAPPF